MFSSFLTFKIVKIMMICTICGLETIYLRQHMSIHTDQKLFDCDKCDKTLGEIFEILNLAQFQESRIYSTLQVTIKEQQSLFSLV